MDEPIRDVDGNIVDNEDFLREFSDGWSCSEEELQRFKEANKNEQ